jgi:hypothetical protein
MTDDEYDGVTARQQHRAVKLFVEEVLEQLPNTRNSDKLLIFEVWKRQGVNLTITPDYYDASDIGVMFNPESIIRVRAEIQNKEFKFLPTLPEIMIRRHIKEDAIKRYYATDQATLQDYMNLKYKVK